VDVARSQAKVLIRIVNSDPYLTSRLNTELILLNDKMDGVVRSVEHMKHRTLHTEERVDDIQARMEQLEMLPVARKSWQNTHTHLFNGLFSETNQISGYEKGKTSLDFTEARDSEWQWHQLGCMPSLHLAPDR